MVRHRRLTDVAARREIAGANLRQPGELANDRETRRVRERVEEADVGIDVGDFRTRHAGIISTRFNIDKYRYNA